MKVQHIRSLFTDFFEKKGHALVESSSLVPQNDPSLLFTNSGMVQFKDVFLGKEKRSYHRATTVQRCLRAGGKHNDLENVGRTARHHTFFEMLGNFSFGDYFKSQAIAFAWEWVTEHLGLAPDRLFVTVFEQDEESATLWREQQKLPAGRLIRLGHADNFWAMGETGPCGPCSEIYVDRGKAFGCGKLDCQVGCACDRFMEIWNLVFMQFNRLPGGELVPLPKPSVDTGAGLERLASVMQGVSSNYDIDLFRDLIEHIAAKAPEASGARRKEEEVAVSLRVVADHLRAGTFLIADGVFPSSEGRGYVLRRILRRAIRHGKKLGFQKPFLDQASTWVIQAMGGAYPHLKDQQDLVQRVLHAEEEQFLRTLDKGLSLLEEEMSRQRQFQGASLAISGALVFQLYDTYGFPLDLTRVVSAEQGFSLDEQGFDARLLEQRKRSREHWKGSGEKAQDLVYFDLVAQLQSLGHPLPLFERQSTSCVGKCLALLGGEGGLQPVSQVNQREEGWAIFDHTVFYPEGGGQVGDTGFLFELSAKESTPLAQVLDAQKPLPDLILVRFRMLGEGCLKLGQQYWQVCDIERRLNISRHHTATHLLHGALRALLGAHVKQAGSLVTPDFLRLDFSHFQPLTRQEWEALEQQVNEVIRKDYVVTSQEVPKEEALAQGAIAFFGEKYPERVRTVRVGPVSLELCGGTHVERSSQILLFKIASETSVAAGVRRIVAHVSEAARTLFHEKEEALRGVQKALGVSSTAEVSQALDRLIQQRDALQMQWDQFQAERFQTEVNHLVGKGELWPLASGRELEWFSGILDWEEGRAKKLRAWAEKKKQQHPKGVCVLALRRQEPDEVFLLIGVGAQWLPALSAAACLQFVATQFQIKGGGKPDLAQAGGSGSHLLPEMLACVNHWVKTQLAKQGFL